MKSKFSILFSALSLAVFMTGFSFNLRAEVDSTAAWLNNADFTEYMLGTVLKTSTTDPPGTVWTGNHDVRIQDVGATNTTNSTAAGNVLGFVMNEGDTFGESAQSGGRTVTKTFDNALSGYVYVKTAFYHNTYGTMYQFKDSNGNIVFEFGSNTNNNANNALLFTGKTNADVLLGNRGKWSDVEFVLDVNPDAPKLLKIILTHNSVSKSFTDIELANGGEIKNLAIINYKGGASGGFDNTTIGRLIADQIKDLTGDANLNTIPDQSVTKSYSLTAYAEVMDSTLDIPSPALDVAWSVSDWGELAAGEQDLVSITRDPDDYTQAELSVSGAISTNATITLKATLGETELTLSVTLKAPSTDALKAELLDEITAAQALTDPDADDNPFLTGITGTLSTAIEDALGVYNNSEATLAGVSQAIGDIKAAQTAFNTALAPYTAFVAYIASVQAIHDAETRSTAFFTEIKATLQTAITTATGARSTVASADDISAAQATLAAALAEFESNVPVYASLETAIANNTATRNNANARAGDKFLNYTAATITAMDEAISAANNVLSTGTTAEALNAAISELNTAIAALKATRNAPQSGKTYQISTYGVDGGNGNTDKKILYADVVADAEIADTLKYSDNATVAVENDKWYIAEVSTGVYTIQNKATGKYINGAGFSDVAVNLTLPENTGQNGEIKVDEGYFQYGIGNADNRYLEVDANNKFVVNTALPNRLRFCFQFEELVDAQAPVITEQPQDTTVNEGGEAILTVTASVEDGGILSYQWYQNETDSKEGGSPVGEDSPSYAPSTASVETLYYYVVVTNTNTGVNGATTASVTSNTATVTVSKGTGIKLIDVNASKAVKSVSYFDLLGRSVPENTQGTVIRRTIYEDNSVKTDKVFNAYRK
jgi:hypothetical protein